MKLKLDKFTISAWLVKIIGRLTGKILPFNGQVVRLEGLEQIKELAQELVEVQKESKEYDRDFSSDYAKYPFIFCAENLEVDNKQSESGEKNSWSKQKKVITIGALASCLLLLYVAHTNEVEKHIT